jgi:hypothetical protein
MKNSLLVLILALCWTSPLHSQRRPEHGPVKVGVSCKAQSHALESGVYGFAVLEHVWPPAFPASRGITVAVQFRPEIKAFLHTDGSKFELWVGTADVPGNNVWEFLEDLADACHLPADPADAVKLLKIRWEAKELQRVQFEQLHKDFIASLTDYVSTVRERSAYFMATTGIGGGVDAAIYPIVYDNSWEHFEIEEWDLPINGQPGPMIKWLREFQSVAEQTFPKSFGKKE